MATPYDPTAVSPAVVGAMSLSEKEALLFCQQTHSPLSGNILKVVQEKSTIVRKEKEQSK